MGDACGNFCVFQSLDLEWLPVRGIWATDPLGDLEFLHLNTGAKLVLTDSGGLQEETTVLGVPCITMRHNTERPVTVNVGTNLMVGNARKPF